MPMMHRISHIALYTIWVGVVVVVFSFIFVSFRVNLKNRARIIITIACPHLWIGLNMCVSCIVLFCFDFSLVVIVALFGGFAWTFLLNMRSTLFIHQDYISLPFPLILLPWYLTASTLLARARINTSCVCDVHWALSQTSASSFAQSRLLAQTLQLAMCAGFYLSFRLWFSIYFKYKSCRVFVHTFLYMKMNSNWRSCDDDDSDSDEEREKYDYSFSWCVY